MNPAIGWVLFGVPLAAAIVAASGLYRNWSTERYRVTKILAIVMGNSAALRGCGATAYVQLVPPLQDYSVEALGFCFHC
jgi:hypothetical protein